MWGYYVALALRSCRRSKALTALVVALLALGVSACMVSYAVFRATTSDPMPGRSSQLFAPQIDNAGPAHAIDGEPPEMLSYIDAVALLKAAKAKRQALVYSTRWGVESNDPSIPALAAIGDAVTADFFPMFAVPFRFGGGWAPNDDERHASMVVISRALNDKLFGGRNSVGQGLRLDGKAFQIAGVLDDWKPRPRFFDMATLGGSSALDDAGDVFIPFTRATDMKKDIKFPDCRSDAGATDPRDWDAYLHGECDRIAAWVELPTAADVAGYREYLRGYAQEQQRLGRFAWPPNVGLHDLMDWMDYLRVAPPASSLSMLVSASFLLIVLINVVGLMLARFMRRAPEIGIRRALGASRASIYRQFLIEGASIGFVGGLFGVTLTLLGLWGIGGLFEPKIARMVHIDASLIGLTVLLSIAATVVAALYPTWRAARIAPAWQIKINP
ncbi:MULTISPECIES: FtsX-like permease family protein [Luteibacter]|uniref:ABC transporter permease n=1 Tax=Luteibacter sp. dw_328 TaxID=2719796 RepID=UPI0007BF8B46|nr:MULTISPECIES: FtsX-like permease family protein [Luteibacter]